MISRVVRRSLIGRAHFGLVSEYNDRVNKKLYKGV